MFKGFFKTISAIQLLVSTSFFLLSKDYDAAILFALWAILIAIYALDEKKD